MAFAARFSLVSLTAAALFALPALPQQPPQQRSPSIAEAASISHQQISQSAKHPRVLTNDDFPKRQAPAQNSAFRLPSTSDANAQLATDEQDPSSGASNCYNPAAAQFIVAQLQAAEDQRDQLQRSLSEQPSVISGNNLDARNYQPGYSGIYVGSAPLQESQPEAPARIDLVTVDEQIASLKSSLQLACEEPEAAAIQQQLDAINADLDWSQRQLALHQDTFYANPNYARDTAGQTQLEAQQQYIDSLVSEKAQLTEQLTAMQADEQPTQPDTSPTAAVEPQP